MTTPYGAYERVIIRSGSGSVVGTGFGCPRCYRALDSRGRDLADDGRVDLPRALRLLAASRRCTRRNASAG